MNKQLLIDAFREISVLETDRFKSKAYLNGVMVLSNMSEDEFKNTKSFLGFKGIGMSLNTKILEFRDKGILPAKLYSLREEKRTFLDPNLYKIRKGFISKKLPYNTACYMASNLVSYAKSNGIEDISIHYFLGSFRRKKPFVSDFDLLLRDQDTYSKLVELLQNNPDFIYVVSGGRKTTFKFNNIENTTIDISWCDPIEYPTAVLHFTGSASSNIRLRSIAKEKGMILNQYGLFKIDNHERIDVFSELDIFEKLGEPYVEPENR